MENKVSSLKDLIIAYICSTGELSYEQYVNSITLKSVYSESYLVKEVNRLCNDKYVRKYESKNGEIFLRLCYPKGEERAKEISPELFFHYCLLAGKTDNDKKIGTEKIPAPKRFNGGGTREARRQETSKIIFKLKEQAIYTDCIRVSLDEESEQFKEATINKFDTTGSLKPQSIFESNGERVEKKYFMGLIDPMKPAMIINRALMTRTDDHQRSDMTRTIGLLFQNTKAFLVYYHKGIKFRWNVNCEKTMKDIYKKDIETFPQEQSPGGLFFVKNMKTAIDVLSEKNTDSKNDSKKDENTRLLCEPTAVFPQSYIYPLDQDSEPLIDILLSKNGEEGYNETIHKDKYAGEKKETAVIGSIKLYNLAFMNYEKLLNAKEGRKKASNIAIECMTWQKDWLIQYLNMTAEEAADLVITIDEEIKEYASNLTGKEYL